MALAVIAEVMQPVRLVEVRRGYMQPVAEIEAAYSGLVGVQGLLLQMHLLQMQVQGQAVAADKTDSARRWS